MLIETQRTNSELAGKSSSLQVEVEALKNDKARALAAAKVQTIENGIVKESLREV